jgi:hypothetical protein
MDHVDAADAAATNGAARGAGASFGAGAATAAWGERSVTAAARDVVGRCWSITSKPELTAAYGFLACVFLAYGLLGYGFSA